MWFAIAAILVVLWVLGFLTFHIAGALIHLLLILAVIAIVVQLFAGRRSS